MKKNIFNAFLFALVLTISAQVSFGQKTAPNTKKQLVKNLVESTFSSFPINFFENNLEEVKKKSINDFKTEMSNMLNSKIDENANFTAEKKASIKEKVPAVADQLGERVKLLVTDGLDITKWLKEGLADNYEKQLTLAEIKQINTFLKSPAGKTFSLVIKEIATADFEKRTPDTNSILNAKDTVQINKFMKTPAAVKFKSVFTEDMDQFIKQRIDAWGEDVLKKIQTDVEDGELNKLLVGFFTENFT
ncbi:MAG TPA: DUF2059 domain-containing protein [Pyrinomonadaceae bacterium]|nr:DUF2059 domain-containing protein [Pyrinomonadaceae bacterium]